MRKLLYLIALSASVSFGDVIMNPPFTRAKGMAEAFTAVGGDLSAVYYNPATLINFSLEKAIRFFSIGGGTDFYLDGRKRDMKPTGTFFIGAGGGGNTFGLAVAGYSLSRISFPCNANLSFSYCKQNTNVIQLATALKVFRIGKTGTGLAVGGSFFGGVLSSYDEYSGDEEVNEDMELDSGFGYSAGAYLRFFESEYISLDAGVSYRSLGDIYEEDEFGFTEKNVFFDIPPALFYGVSAKMFLPFATLIISYDEQETYYSEMDIEILEDSKRRSVGVEVASEKVALRGGIFMEDFEESSIESRGFTAGASFRVGNVIFSGAGEFRRTDFAGKNFNTASLHVSLDLQW